MLFNSVEFFAFLAVVVPVYFLLPNRWRPLFLALASYYFYMFSHPEFGWLLFTSTTVSYLGGLAMDRTAKVFQRRAVLVFCIVVNVGLLAFFKYGDLIGGSLNSGLHALHLTATIPRLHVALPIGISFFTFQALSYCFDVYSRRFPVERRFDVFAAYKAFFPQLVAGPIERPGNIIPQMRAEHHFDYERMVSGLRLMLWGFFKKLVIADRLSVIVAEVYGSPGHHSSLQLLSATYAFSFQIYGDFSGYTDIARGCARILGIDLMENFRAPYFAQSIPEFWGRWHISLSTWFRDYLYIPLGGNRLGVLRWQVNIMVVFLVSGLWHGADWKFAIWGMLHGIFFLVTRWLSRWSWNLPASRWAQSAWAGAKIIITFHLVAFAWIFFRANTMGDALLIVRKIVSHPLQTPILTPLFGVPDLLVSAGAVAVLALVNLFEWKGSPSAVLDRCPVWVRWPAYYAIIFAIVLYAPLGEREFIYFQF
ncbi:MAG: MBOAT family O-acyltransferase [Chthoniobacter sp.]